MEFNKEQLSIINQLQGAFLINAPVGTGKTTVLTQRVIEALKQGFKPADILCLTFTNRAADEMRSRVRQAVNSKETFDDITISTFHGWCAAFLKAEAKQLGLAGDYTILDEDEQIALIKTIAAGFSRELYLNDTSHRQEFANLLESLYRYRTKQLEFKIGIIDKPPLDKLKEAIATAYEKALGEQNALDFNQLVLQTLEALYFNPDLKTKWAERYKFIQLDEFQDTHLSEYLVIKELAKAHKNIALIGDLDQTIYSWRGSQPHFIAKLFKTHFAPVSELSLTINYRSRRELLTAVKKVLAGMTDASTKQMEGGSDDKFVDCLKIFNAHNFNEEIDWVIGRIKEIKDSDPQASIAVLSRTHNLINQASEVFTAKKLPHLTVDHYNFFKRQEIKDALAHIKILLNRFDLDSAYRIASRPPKDLGEATIAAIRQAGAATALKVSDFLYLPNFSRQEPFAQLIAEHKTGRLVVLDTETTGTNPARDEIVQVYAREVVNGRPGEELHAYLKNTLPVGASAAIHRLTDEFLAANGEEPAAVLAKLKTFIGASAVVGHNVGFDIAMILANGARQKIEFGLPADAGRGQGFKNFYDTLDLARRLVNTDSYKLSSLAKLFNLAGATHSADDDVDATINLLAILVAKLALSQGEREQLFTRYSKKFIRLASQLTNWQSIINKERPAHALEKIINESGLKDYYAKQPEAAKRLASLDSLIKFFGQRDNLNQAPLESLRSVVSLSALVKNVDFLALDQGQIPILTVHQVKGLEFDHVFLVGLNEGQFPLYRTEDMEEEKRLFYVALTRARQSLNLSYSNFDRFGRPSAKSRFLDYLT